MKRSIPFFLALVFLIIAPANAEWQPKAANFEKMDSAALRQMFKDGPFMIVKRRTKTTVPEITCGIIVEAETTRVWKALTDYINRPKVIPGVLKVEDLKWDKNKATFTQRNSIKFSFIRFAWDEYRVHVHYPEKKIVFYEPEKPDDAIGGYELIPIDNGKATLLLYSFIADLTKMGFPVGAMAREMPLVEEILMCSAAIMVVTGSKEYAEKHVK